MLIFQRELRLLARQNGDESVSGLASNVIFSFLCGGDDLRKGDTPSDVCQKYRTLFSHFVVFSYIPAAMDWSHQLEKVIIRQRQSQRAKKRRSPCGGRAQSTAVDGRAQLRLRIEN